MRGRSSVSEARGAEPEGARVREGQPSSAPSRRRAAGQEPMSFPGPSSAPQTSDHQRNNNHRNNQAAPQGLDGNGLRFLSEDAGNWDADVRHCQNSQTQLIFVSTEDRVK